MPNTPYGCHLPNGPLVCQEFGGCSGCQILINYRESLQERQPSESGRQEQKRPSLIEEYRE